MIRHCPVSPLTLLTFALTASLAITGCGDDGTSADASVDMGFPNDTGPGVDMGFPADLGPTDLGSRDTGMPADTGPNDTGPSDTGPADTGDAGVPCGPVARANAPAVLGAAFAGFIQRCQPELSQQESIAVAAGMARKFSDRFSDTALIYDDVAAGQCSCDLALVNCDEPYPIRSTSCNNVATGTITDGNFCRGEYCEPGFRCWGEFGERTEPSCPGTCVAEVAAGGDCDSGGSLLPCELGTFCIDLTKQGRSCEPLGDLGDRCGRISACKGQRDALIYPTAQCDTSSTTPTCVLPGRQGANCRFDSNCHWLYACEGSSCTLKPGAGDACALDIDVPSPTPNELYQNIYQAQYACRLSPWHSNPASFCVQTGTTSGQGTCLDLPAAGTACGIGQNLSPWCQPGSHCSAIDNSNLAPVMGVCEPTIAPNASCDPSWDDSLLGPQCDALGCDFGDPSVCSNDPDTFCIND